MERQLELASKRDLNRDDRIEMIAEARGAVRIIDFILSGGLDIEVRRMLDLPDDIPRAPEDYMPIEWAPEERQ